MSPRAPRSPSSPLTPGRMDSLAIPSQQRHRPSRQHVTGASANSLRLPSLPRFHPANFPSGQNSSASNTPPTNPASPTSPASPRQQHRQYSEAQRQLYVYQRELIANNARQTNGPTGRKPVSPRLIPLGSPGPVTPLELEQQTAGSYFATVSSSSAAQNELVERMMEDSQRQGPMQIHARPVASR